MRKNSNSRSINSFRNITIGIGSQIVTLLMTFISRTVFIKLLGAEYLGINGLFSNVLTVLSLAELGIGNVMMYSLYKPVAENDESKIISLLNYYKNIYRKIAVAVLILGMSIIPFLDKIVDSEMTFKNIVLFYVLFLVNSVVSYFVAYKTALIIADQKNYMINTINTLFSLIRDIIQIIVMLETKNYILFLCVQIICTISNNIYFSFTANKLYPFLRKRMNLVEIDTKNIKENISSMFLYKMGVVMMNNTDNILISTIISTIYVGYYSNYSLLITVITTFIGVIIQAMLSSIGNLNTEGSVKKSYKFFNTLLLFFHLISAISSLCFLLVVNDFIRIWIGESYLLGKDVVFAIVFNFYIQNIINPVWIYRETMGLFNRIKYIMIIAAIINLGLSIILGRYWGLSGIIISTAIARLLTTIWYEPSLLYRIKFKQPVRKYWERQFKYFVVTLIAMSLSIYFCYFLPTSISFIFIKISIGIIVMCCAFFVTNYNNEEFKMLRGYVLKFFNR